VLAGLGGLLSQVALRLSQLGVEQQLWRDPLSSVRCV